MDLILDKTQLTSIFAVRSMAMETGLFRSTGPLLSCNQAIVQRAEEEAGEVEWSDDSPFQLRTQLFVCFISSHSVVAASSCQLHIWELQLIPYSAPLLDRWGTFKDIPLWNL